MIDRRAIPLNTLLGRQTMTNILIVNGNLSDDDFLFIESKAVRSIYLRDSTDELNYWALIDHLSALSDEEKYVIKFVNGLSVNEIIEIESGMIDTDSDVNVIFLRKGLPNKADAPETRA